MDLNTGSVMAASPTGPVPFRTLPIWHAKLQALLQLLGAHACAPLI